jgi:hypothetical protein
LLLRSSVDQRVSAAVKVVGDMAPRTWLPTFEMGTTPSRRSSGHFSV